MALYPGCCRNDSGRDGFASGWGRVTDSCDEPRGHEEDIQPTDAANVSSPRATAAPLQQPGAPFVVVLDSAGSPRNPTLSAIRLRSYWIQGELRRDGSAECVDPLFGRDVARNPLPCIRGDQAPSLLAGAAKHLGSDRLLHASKEVRQL